MKFLLDTSFIMSAAAFRIDIEDGLRKFGKPELFVLSLVLGELKGLAEGRGREGMRARISLQLIEKLGATVIRTKLAHTDRVIVRQAVMKGMAVCTADRSMRETLLRRGVSVVEIRRKKLLHMLIPG